MRQDIPGQGAQISHARALALARCEQQQRCDFMGDLRKYPTMGSCVADVLEDERVRLERYTCATQPEQTLLGTCLGLVRSMGCAQPFSDLDQLSECAPDALCARGT